MISLKRFFLISLLLIFSKCYTVTTTTAPDTLPLATTATSTSPLNSIFFTITSQHIYGLSHGNQVSSARILKSGESCSSSGYLVNLFYYGGGGSIETAKQKGNISKVAVIDRKSINILYNAFYSECIIVWGE